MFIRSLRPLQEKPLILGAEHSVLGDLATSLVFKRNCLYSATGFILFSYCIVLIKNESWPASNSWWSYKPNGRTHYCHFAQPVSFPNLNMYYTTTDKCSSHLWSKKLLFGAEIDHYRKLQLVKIQRTTDHRVLSSNGNI